MKFLIILAALCSIAACSTSLFSEKQLNYLASLKYEHLPREVKSLIDMEKNKAGDNSHYCCTNDQPVNIVQRTKIDKEVHVVATKIKTGYTSCGFNGWMMCSLYTTAYRQVVFYHIVTYEVPDEDSCPDHHVKCCKDYIEVAGNCLALTTISTHLDLLTMLLQAGLIAPAGK